MTWTKPPGSAKGPCPSSIHLCTGPQGSWSQTKTCVCVTVRKQVVPATHGGPALTTVLGPPGSDSSTGDTVCRRCCLLWRGLPAQDNEMRLSPREEETDLCTFLAAQD